MMLLIEELQPLNWPGFSGLIDALNPLGESVLFLRLLDITTNSGMR